MCAQYIWIWFRAVVSIQPVILPSAHNRRMTKFSHECSFFPSRDTRILLIQIGVSQDLAHCLCNSLGHGSWDTRAKNIVWKASTSDIISSNVPKTYVLRNYKDNVWGLWDTPNLWIQKMSCPKDLAHCLCSSLGHRSMGHFHSKNEIDPDMISSTFEFFRLAVSQDLCPKERKRQCMRSWDTRKIEQI